LRSTFITRSTAAHFVLCELNVPACGRAGNVQLPELLVVSIMLVGLEGEALSLKESRQSKKPYGVLQIGGYDFIYSKINRHGIGGYSVP
jgi:hypothetical protein